MILAVSDDAAQLIRTLARKAGAPTRPALRITVDRRHDSLSMNLASAPTEGDVIVSNHDTAVFVSAAASRRLAGRTLQASTRPERSAFFLT